MSFFKKISEGLLKTKSSVLNQIDNIARSFVRVDEEFLEELLDILVASDLGVKTSQDIIDRLREKVKDERENNPQKIKELLSAIVADMCKGETTLSLVGKPAVVLVVGVNGVGKTTSIAKLAAMMKNEGKSVILGAADTFRAAAAAQLKLWADRAGADIVMQAEGADPAAVVFDTIKAAKARGSDVIIIDTAGRLHNKKNLMNELNKISRVIERELPDTPFETLLCLDATTGQNGVSQAREFKEVAPLSGIVLTKLDGTAKGGIIVTIRNELQIPVKFVGVGEKMDDLQQFNAEDFAKALFIG